MGRGRKIKIDATLVEMCLGILIYSIACQAAILIFSGKAAYSAGLWIGAAAGITGVIHMWWALNRGLGMGEKGAVKTVGAHSIIRYAAFMAVMVLCAMGGFADPVFVFIGYMGIKASAYMQPFIHRISSKARGMQ